jgi:selT/selW/selH-like putative selenoprotein
LSDEFGAEVELVEGGGGIFDITVDGRLAFSKKSTGRFPTEDDLRALAD